MYDFSTLTLSPGPAHMYHSVTSLLGIQDRNSSSRLLVISTPNPSGLVVCIEHVLGLVSWASALPARTGLEGYTGTVPRESHRKTTL